MGLKRFSFNIFNMGQVVGVSLKPGRDSVVGRFPEATDAEIRSAVKVYFSRDADCVLLGGEALEFMEYIGGFLVDDEDYVKICRAKAELGGLVDSQCTKDEREGYVRILRERFRLRWLQVKGSEDARPDS